MSAGGVALVRREAWHAREPTAPPSRLAAPPRGAKIHYMGARVDPRIVEDHRICVAYVQGVQDQHIDDNGWQDIGYTGLACPHRQVFMGRGPGAIPAANGSGLNSGHYALAAVLGDEGYTEPTAGLLAGLADGIRWLREVGGAGPEIEGHRDGFATDCPGDALYAVVRKWQREGLPGITAPPPGPAITPPGVAPPFKRILEYPPYMRGLDVLAWQAQMRRRGWNIAVDGVFGPASTAVAAEFATRKGIKGAGGRVTRAAWVAAFELPIL